MKKGIIKGILRGAFEKKMLAFYSEVKRFKLPRFVEIEVLRLAKECVEKKLTMSYSKEELSAGLIFLVLRNSGFGPLSREMVKSYEISKKRLFRVTRFLMKKLKISSAPCNEIESYLARAVNELGVDYSAVGKAMEIGKKLEVEHTPLKAAICLSIVLKEGVSVAKISKVLGVSAVAVRRRLNHLLKLRFHNKEIGLE